MTEETHLITGKALHTAAAEWAQCPFLSKGFAADHITASYKRFLEGRLREHFKLVGTPIRIEMRSAANPFDNKGH